MMMATKGKRPLRHLTATDKIDAIQRIHDGESKASVARDIGVPESTLRGWCKNEEKLRYMSRQSAENAEKLTNEATAAALTAVAAAELFNGPPEKRLKLEQGLFGNGKMKYDDSFYKSPRGPMNGLDLSGGDKGLGVSGGDIIMNGLHGADFSSFAKTAAEISALSKSKELNLKGYGADLSKHGDPNKADLSMAAISPLTSLSHLSGMSSLAQSPLALSFNEIATNLNLIAQLNNNHNLATMSNLGGMSAAQSLRNARPKANTSQSPRTSSLPESNGADKTPSLTVRNLAKLQQKTSGDLSNGRDPNAPVDEALWYWLKSQQAMLGLNNLYSSMPRPSSPQQSSSPPQQHQQVQHHPSTQTPTPPIVSTPQPTPPSSAPSLTPEDTKNSSWFWQWYKTFGASLMPGDKSNNNTINANANSKPTSYENILYSQLTKGQNSTDSLNNNAQPINLNINSTAGPENVKSEPEDLSNHNNSAANLIVSPEDHNRFNPSPSTSLKSDHKPEDGDEQPDSHGVEERPAELNCNGKVKEVLDNLFQNHNSNDDRASPSARHSVSPVVSSNHNGNSNEDNGDLVTSNGADELKSDISEDSNQLLAGVDIKSSADAVEHGEKFLKWLESCSDPNVTAMQVVQFKYLLNSIKLSAERQQQAASSSTGGAGGEERTRVRRRK
ncbi:protein distal antenna-like isoform X2 [Topomyia yanbarensis]|uniref:protein distal antenna-like isoform X2 n=1 Tax=Topomyia yanbarensis TaxID=2498891 RepID=UPI00273BCE9A|nr:protein distal antenna-like isoform X2 [Topomyia yanbarensis]